MNNRNWNLWRIYGPRGTICWLALPIGTHADHYQQWPELTQYECKGFLHDVTKEKAEEVLTVFSGVIK